MMIFPPIRNDATAKGNDIACSTDAMAAALESESRSEEALATHIQGGDAISDSKWAQAVQSLSDDDREQFGIAQPLSGQDPLSVLEDILAATEAKKEESLNKRWKVTVKGRTIIIRDVLEKMTLLALQCDPTGAALPWAAIKLFMQAAVNDVEIFAYTLTALEKIANIIGRSQIFEQLYLNKQNATSPEPVFHQLSASVIKLYATVLQYLAGVLRYYRTGTAIRFLKSTVKSKADLEGEFRRLEEAQVETLRLAQLAEAQRSKDVALAITNINKQQSKLDENNASRFDELRGVLQDFERPISRINAQLAQIQDELDHESRVKILRAISTIPYATHHKVASQGRLPGSGQWLLNKEVYTAWRASSSSSVLWLHGIPGSGKTKLATLVVDDLKVSEHIAFFYCMRNPSEPFRALCQPILASLVRQLASLDPRKPLLSPVVSHYQDALDDYIGFEDQSWTVDDCRRVLTELSNEYPAVTIVIDALDEVDGEDRQELMDALGELLQESTSLVKIFISSRDNTDIALSLEGSPNVYIEADDNAIDIEAFITDQLAKAKLLHGKLSDTLHTEICDTLLAGAKGMFRWVELQIQSLRRLKVAADVRARLGHLPETLEGTYWEVYQQILDSGENAAKLAIFTFQWLLYAKHTIPLKSFTKFASIALSNDKDVVYSSNEVVDVCTNFIVRRTDSFQFAHLSVREFLEHLPKRQVTTMMAEAGHVALARACLLRLQSIASEMAKIGIDQPQRYKMLIDKTSSDYDLKDEWEEDTRSEEKTRPEIEDSEKPAVDAARPVYSAVLANRYAAVFWMDHVTASRGSTTAPSLRELLRSFLVDNSTKAVAPGFASWCLTMQHESILSNNRHWSDLIPDNSHRILKDAAAKPPNPLWAVCIYNWPDLVEDLYRANYPDMESWRKVEHATKYLDHGPASRSSDGGSDMRLTMTPLLYAVTAGYNKLVQTLVHCQSKFAETIRLQDTQQDEIGAVELADPLFRATASKNTELVIHLLDNGYSSAESFGKAAADGNLEILEIFLQKGTDIQSVGYRGLMEACSSGSSVSMNFLLEHGCHPEPGGPLLSRAVFNHHADLSRLLLERGIGLERRSDVFVVAVTNDYHDLVTILLEHNAQKDPVAVVKQIVFDAETSALRLIEAGWDIHGRYLEKRRTALHYAAEKGHVDVVAALLKRGVAVDVFDRSRNTPLHLAALRGRDKCVELLLSHGADALAEDRDENIALDLAEKRNHPSAARIIRGHMEHLLEELRSKTDERADQLQSVPGSAEEGETVMQGEIIEA
ncbi:hypothetical protein PG993_000958 [Apiospora rasikravindrae]|uniref:NACHT domain-containing protein n=1 Tax=Apiospora rasikravindrae TaxID=990691 RepID=A0ABR1UC44_9PEZI